MFDLNRQAVLVNFEAGLLRDRKYKMHLFKSVWVSLGQKGLERDTDSFIIGFMLSEIDTVITLD
jgi:hypothetical protein